MENKDNNKRSKDKLKKYYDEQFEKEHKRRSLAKDEDFDDVKETHGKNKDKKTKREKNNKKKKKINPIKRFFNKIFKFLGILILILIILITIGTIRNGGGINGFIMTLLGLSNNEISDLEPKNILLLGISEDIETKLTDTIMLCTYNPNSIKASMLSIPRDTFIGKNKSNAKGSDKINSVFAKDPDKLLEDVTDLTSIEVSDYIVINNNALIQIVDVIGGVQFDVPIDMDYDDPTQDLHIHLKAGLQKIDGEEAEELLRFRHNNDGTSYPASYGDNDYGRMRTQREFIKETVNQTINIKNVLKIPRIVSTIKKNIETNMQMKDLLIYVPSALGFSTEDIFSNQLPGESQKINGLWFYVADKKGTKTLVKSIYDNLGM